jgi:predicted amidohydrolase
MSFDEDDSLIRLADVVSLATNATDRLYRVVFATLARRFRIYIAAGSALLLQRDGRVLAVSHLFDPRGRTILTQPRTHLRNWERAWGLGSATELSVIDTPLGRVGSLGAGESMIFEPTRILWSLGAEVVCSQTADVGPQLPGHLLRGAWARVQESPSYAVQGALSGDAFGLTFDGTAAIFAPRELTEARDGIVARVRAGHGEDAVVVADLDLNALRSLRVGQPRPLNRAMIGSYLPELYTHPWPWTEP